MVVIGMFLINDIYANVLFDTYADRSYINLEFRKLLTIYIVNLGRLIE